MTVVCAITDGTHTWIGSDTYGVAGNGTPVPTGKKWFGAHGWAFGHAGDSYAAGIISQEAVHLFGNTDDPYKVISRLRTTYEVFGMKAVYGQGEATGSWLNSGILVRAGLVWDIDDRLAINQMPSGVLHARGCAGIEAAAAAYGFQMAQPKASPEVLIATSLKAAARFDIHIRGAWQGRITGESHAKRPSDPVQRPYGEVDPPGDHGGRDGQDDDSPGAEAAAGTVEHL
jgi:hypothetical protein